MSNSVSSYLLKNGVDAHTAQTVSVTVSSMMQGNPEKFLLAAQLAVAAAAGPGSFTRGGKTRPFEGWPCKWYVPDFDSDQSSQDVKALAGEIARMA